MSKGLSSVKTLSAKEIAKKWNLPLTVVSKKIAAGVKIEKEHTKSTRQANEIARDHLGERPDYYEKLDKMEKKPVVKEQVGVQGVRGLGYVSGDPSGADYVEKYINTNSMAYEDENGNRVKFMKKAHHNLHNKLGFKEFDLMKIKKNTNKDLAESLGSDYGTAAVPVIGDLTGSSRKVAKIDEVNLKKITDKISPKVKKKIKNVAAAATLAGNALAGADAFQNASTQQGSPISNVVNSAAGLPGKVGYAFFAGKSAKSGFDLAKDHLKSKQMKKEEKNIVPANSTERGIYEATYKGKKVPLNKPMKGDVKKSKVFVDPDGDGKAQKVNFGDPNLSIKKNQPNRKKSYCARSGGISGKTDKTSANYWSRRAWNCEESALDEARRVRFIGKQNPADLPPRPADYKSGDFGSKLAREGGIKYPGKKKSSKPIKEEQIDEIKAATVGSAVAKASAERKEITSKKMGNKEVAKWWKRERLVRAGVNKLTGKSKVPASLEEYANTPTNEYTKPYSTKSLVRTTRTSHEHISKPDTIEEPGRGGHVSPKNHLQEETKMDTKELINEALDNILDENLVAMKENLMTALQEKAMEKLEERKKIIAANYFAQ